MYVNDSLIFLYKTDVSDLSWFNLEVTHFMLHLQLKTSQVGTTVTPN